MKCSVELHYFMAANVFFPDFPSAREAHLLWWLDLVGLHIHPLSAECFGGALIEGIHPYISHGLA